MDEGIAQFKKYIGDSGLKATRQRELIVRTFFRAGGHISAQELYRRVRGRDPRIGLVTVYRTLKLLRGAGLAEERQFHDHFALYEPAIIRHHDHMICTRCGEILEFEECKIEALQVEVARRFGFTILTHKLELYGLCKACKAASPKAGSGRGQALRLLRRPASSRAGRGGRGPF